MNKNIGLALGGGAALGAAHIGVLKAIEELEISISHLAGTSIGACIAALRAFGKSAQDIEEIALGLQWLDVSSLSLSRCGLLSHEKLGDIIKEVIGDATFDQADIPLAMVATDICNGEKVILKKGDVATAVMASACIPGIFAPVERDGRLLVDGGLVENVPVSPLREMRSEQTVAVDLSARRSYPKPENIVEILLNAFDFAILNATKLQMENADLIIAPDLTSFTSIDIEQAPDLIEKGYTEARDVLKREL